MASGSAQPRAVAVESTRKSSEHTHLLGAAPSKYPCIHFAVHVIDLRGNTGTINLNLGTLATDPIVLGD